MSQLFNSSLTGSFSLSSCLTRAVSTVGASVSTGILPISINTDTVFSPTFNIETLPVRSIYLNIHSVAKNATGVLKIILNTDIGIANQFNYPLSALAQGKYTGIDHTSSQYWQGFYVEDTDLGNASILSIGLSCSNSNELIILGKGNNFNKYIIPVSAWNNIEEFDPFSDILISGHLYPDMSVVSAANIICDKPTDTNIINITNGGTVKIVPPGGLLIQSQLLVSVGGTLSANGIARIGLNPNSKLIGLDASTIILNGPEKLPYTYLTSEVATGDSQLLVRDDISTWKDGDSVLLLPNSDNINTTETVTIASIASNLINLNTLSVNSHHSLHHPPTHSMFGDFLAAPICNIDRNLNIYSPGAAFIRVEDSCNFSIKNAFIFNLGIDAVGKTGAINIFNTQSVVKNCVIAGTQSTKNGIYIDATTASSFIVNNNIIFDMPLYAVHVEGVFLKNVAQSSITNNVCLNADTGIRTTDLRNVAVTGNTFVGNNNRGAYIENVYNTVPVLNFENNYFYKNINEGAVITNLIGSIKNNTFLFNGAMGVHFNSTNETIPISAAGINSAFNGGAGAYIQSSYIEGSPVIVSTINSLTNNNGVVLDNIYGKVSAVSATNNTLTGIDVYNCYNGTLNLYDFNVNSNNTNIIYHYPSNYNCNFYPTYLTNSTIGTALDSTCIVLHKTNCEKFVAEKTSFNSVGPNITLIPSTTNLIEGSYIFSGCTFSTIKFNDISANYQDNYLNESGFTVMYENNSANQHQKYTAAGNIIADNITFHNTTYQLSEKLIPLSITTPLKSTSKLIPIDNFDNANPPSAAPTSLYVSVWVKKDALWGNNINPQLIVAANPTLNINQETILDTHNQNTTAWVQLSSLTPVATASTIRGAVEVFIRCSGISGGSINIDSWQANYVRV